MILKPAGETDAAEHCGVERQLPGDDGGGDAVVRRQEVQEEAGGRHRVDGVCGDCVCQCVEDRRQRVASHYEQDGGLHGLLEAADNLGSTSRDNSKVSDHTGDQGGHGDTGGADTAGLDEAVT